MFGKKDKKQQTEGFTEIIGQIPDPATGKPLSTDGTLIDIQQSSDKTLVILAAPSDRKYQISLDAAVRTALSKAGSAPENLQIKFEKKQSNISTEDTRTSPSNSSIPGVKNIIAVGSGKGGVGKSTVSANLAAELAKEGLSVGLLDADIYGPSIGKMFGLTGKQNLTVENDRIFPLQKHGVKLMSFAFLIDEAQAVVWRGPMLGKAIQQFLFDIQWGELDYLILDMPPGTGDAHLSMAQLIQTDGAIIVTTPQNVALQDASRAVNMFEQVNVPVLGIIENMSEFVCPSCGHHEPIFSSGGGSELAESSESSMLGQIPLTRAIMEAGESGIPVVLADTEENTTEPVQKAYNSISTALKDVMATLKG